MGARREAMPKDVQFVTDAEGHRNAVILPIEEYEAMMEDLQIGRAARESKAEPRRPFEDVVKELRAADEIDV
jgi:PHD/YefM family antitoxin component YafN of YafNO toxin-antitoxin module